MTIYEAIDKFTPDEINSIINSATEEKILYALAKDRIDYQDFLLLLSPKAEFLLPQIADYARKITIKRFGKIINFYAPLYLSNECSNSCLYCGFNCNNNINRISLSLEAIKNELITLHEIGIDNVLLLTGEAPEKAGLEYINDAVKTANEYFTFIGLEIYPMNVEDYSHLVKSGANGLTLYQETYHKDTYKIMHTNGKKSDYYWRLEAPERACESGFRKVNIGALLGLYDWRYEAAMMALHIDYLQKRYWKNEYALGFPRIRPVDDGFKIPQPVNDKHFVQMLCALRLFLPEVGFVLSTRENADLRDRLLDLCVTQISAGSKTNPGGYTSNYAGEQFEVSDERNFNEMKKVVMEKGYEPVIKDWDRQFAGLK